MVIQGPILPSFTALKQLLCIPKLKEQMLPYTEEISVILFPPLQNAVHTPAAQLRQHWKVELDWVLGVFLCTCLSMNIYLCVRKKTTWSFLKMCVSEEIGNFLLFFFINAEWAIYLKFRNFASPVISGEMPCSCNARGSATKYHSIRSF